LTQQTKQNNQSNYNLNSICC